MKTLITIFTLIASVAAFAAPAPAKKAAPAKTATVKASGQKLTRAQQERIKKMGSAFGTSHQLRGSTIFGKMPSSGASTTTVENDKFLDDLIGSRKNFADREKRDSERQ